MAVDGDGADREAGRTDGRPSLPAGSPRRPALAAGSGVEPTVTRQREPPADVFLGPDSVSVTIELPGVEREDIDLQVTDATLVVVTPGSPLRPGRREITLPARVHGGSARATYRNGVLDVILERVETGS